MYRCAFPILTTLCAILTPLFAHATELQRLSTLTDGSFERQLEVPASEKLRPGSAQMEQAIEVYRQLPFNIGERIRYIITYTGVKAGIAEAIVQTPIKWQNTWAHRISGEVKNADWYSWLIKLHDSVEGIFDNTSAMGPHRFYINQQEPVRFRQTKLLNFDLSSHKVKQITKRSDRAIKHDQFELRNGIKDAFAAYYYFRSHVPADSKMQHFEIPIFTSEKIWTLTANLLKEETVKVYGNSWNCDVYEMQTSFGGLMEQKGNIIAWISRDDRRLIVKAKANIRFGYIELELQEWDPGFPAPSKKKWDQIRAQK